MNFFAQEKDGPGFLYIQEYIEYQVAGKPVTRSTHYNVAKYFIEPIEDEV